MKTNLPVFALQRHTYVKVSERLRKLDFVVFYEYRTSILTQGQSGLYDNILSNVPNDLKVFLYPIIVSFVHIDTCDISDTDYVWLDLDGDEVGCSVWLKREGQDTVLDKAIYLLEWHLEKYVIDVYDWRTRKGMLWTQAAIHVCMGSHFYLLGAFSGAFMNVLGLGQVLTAIPLGKRPGFRKIYLAYLPLIALGAIYTWQGPVSLLAAAGLGTLSLARYQTDIMKFRVFTLAAIAFCSAYDITVMSIPGMSLDVLSLISSLVMIRRERRLALMAP